MSKRLKIKPGNKDAHFDKKKKKDGGQPSRTLYILQGRRCLQCFVVARVSMPCTSWSSHTAAEAAKEKEQKVIKIGLLAECLQLCC